VFCISDLSMVRIHLSLRSGAHLKSRKTTSQGVQVTCKVDLDCTLRVTPTLASQLTRICLLIYLRYNNINIHSTSYTQTTLEKQNELFLSARVLKLQSKAVVMPRDISPCRRV
jgi:hypothetical protein